MKSVLPIVVIAGAMLAATGRVRADDPVSSSVRFTGEVVRILNRKCQACHGPDSLAMPLATYGDVRSWGRAIREEIVEQRMPPPAAARGFGRFRSDLSLSARETLTLLSWLDGGMPRGDERDLPAAAPPDAAPPPDVRIALPAQRVPAHADLVRRVMVPATAVDAARAIARVTIAPGSRRVLKAALVYEGRGGVATRWLGAWLPWQHDASPPDGHAFPLAHGASLIVELHYRGGDQPIADAPAVQVFYARAAQPIEEIAVKGGVPATLARAASVWAIVPDAGARTASLQVTARRPDGSVEALLWMPRFDPDWPQALVLDRPLPLPAGTSLTVVAKPEGAAAQVRVSLLRSSTAVPPSAARRRDGRRADTSTPTPARK